MTKELSGVRPASGSLALRKLIETEMRPPDDQAKWRCVAVTRDRGNKAAMELKRLRGLSPLTARQLFTSMVPPVVDYAFNVWMHECNWKAAPAIHRPDCTS